jgi:hypothetical protein
MLKMKCSVKWAAIAIATLMTSLNPLAAEATVPSDAAVAVVQITTAKLTGPNPKLMARADRSSKRKTKKSKSRRTRLQSKKPANNVSPAEFEKIENAYGAGSRSVSGCISDGRANDCDRLSNSKSALINWCGQGKTQACNRYDLLSSEERYQVTSDAIRRSIQ